MDYIKDCTIIHAGNDRLFVETSYIYLGRIIPNRVIKQKNVYEITYLHPFYFIEGFVVITENNKVNRIVIFGYHPNRDGKSGLYCLPNYKINVIFSEDYFKILLSNIKTFYLDSCHLTPRADHLKYKKLQSIYIQLNQGD